MKRKDGAREDRKAGLMIIRARPLLLFAGKEFMGSMQLAPLGYIGAEVVEPLYNYAIIILHGDGDPQVEVRVTTGSRTVTVNGAQFRVVSATGEIIRVEMRNTDATSWRKGPTVEIAGFRWREL